MPEPKTVFISSFHILISRNIIASPVLELLTGSGFRIVLLVPQEKKQFFEKEFARPNIIIESVEKSLVRQDVVLRYLSLASINTRTLAIKRKTEMKGSGAWLSVIIGNNPVWRWFFRHLDAWLTPRGRFDSLIQRYQPAVIFSTDVQNENDVRLMHEACDNNIPVIGMVRSWDNLTAKGLMRFVPDLLVVNNEIVKKEAVRFHGIQEGRIRTVGIPHYDRYILPAPHTREAFAKIVGLDPSKQWIAYAPTGDRYLGENRIDREVIQVLARDLPPAYQLLIRFPPSDSVNLEGLHLGSNVVEMRPGVDLSGPATFKSNELTLGDDELLRDTIFYTELVITGPSTVVIDGSVFDKPILVIGFDRDGTRPYYESIRRYYDYNHFQPLRLSGGMKIVERMDDFDSFVRDYLEHPEKDREGRKKIVEAECWKLDGRSSERLFEVISSATANQS